MIKRSPACHAPLARSIMLAMACGVAGCLPAPKQAEAQFPTADRPVANIISDRWSTEESRDRLDEAERIMDLADIQPRALQECVPYQTRKTLCQPSATNWLNA